MLRKNHAQGLYALVLEQITRSEALVSDIVLMQREIESHGEANQLQNAINSPKSSTNNPMLLKELESLRFQLGQ